MVRSDGSILFTNPWWTFGDGDEQEMAGGSVLHLWPDQKTVSLVADDVHVPNGIAFSPDEKILFVNDSRGTPEDGKHIRAFDARPDGSIDGTSSRIWARFPPETSGNPGAPDGMKVDRAGNLYCGGPAGCGPSTSTPGTWGRSSTATPRPTTSASAGMTGKPCTSCPGWGCTRSIC